MCRNPDCDLTPRKHVVRTNVPGTGTVVIHDCPACDRRRCNYQGNCREMIGGRTAKRCPKGHPL